MKPLGHEAGAATLSAWLRSDRNTAGYADPGALNRAQMLVQIEQRAQEIRASVFEDLKVRNPLWDILLALLAAQRADKQLSMSDLCAMCDAPESTALRLIHQLRDKGYADMVPDRSDRRRTLVVLTSKAQAQFAAFIRRMDEF